MTDEPALIAAVCDRPDDDTPRGVYADWCDDNAGTVACDWCRGTGEDRRPPFEANGKRYVYHGPVGPCPKCKGDRAMPDGLAARAAFIRAQVELARVACGCNPDGTLKSGFVLEGVHVRAGADCARCKRRAMWRRAAEAFAAIPGDQKYFRSGDFIGEWIVPFDEPRQWVRGFPEVCRSMHSTFWRDHHAAILAAAPIRRVELADVPDVTFGPIETRAEADADRGTTVRTASWEATWGDRRDRFTLQLATRDGEPNVDQLHERQDAQAEASRTPACYLRARWPKVQFVLPRALEWPYTDLGDYNAAATRFQEWQEEARRTLINSLGIPPALLDPRAFIRPPIV